MGPNFFIAPRNSPVMGAILVLVGLGIAGGILKSLVTPGPSPMGEIAFGVAFVAMLLTTGSLFSRKKGGISTENGGITLHGCGDAISIPASEIRGLICHKRASSKSPDAYCLWDIEVRTQSGQVQLVGESTTLEDAITMTRGLEENLRTTATESPEHFSDLGLPGTPQNLDLRMRVTSNVALFWPLVFAAIVSLWAGIAIIWIGKGILTFVAGPPLALLGLSLLGVKLAGILGTHSMTLSENTLTIGFHLGSLPLFSRTLDRVDVRYARIRPNGSKGWLLELTGPDGTCPIVGGVTGNSTPTGLFQLVEQCKQINRALGEPTNPAHPE